MRVNIGIDFGSTNSAFASYNNDSMELRNYTLENNSSASIPSTVTVSTRRGEWLYGDGAKGVVGNNGQRVFEHFKMLLAEKDENLVRSRGYDATYTPRAISQYYLHSVLNKISERENVQIGDIVVCIPENWTRKTGRYLDGRGLLQEILSTDMDGNPIARNVRVVTEPEAASAFFAYDFERNTGRVFSGHLLLIDYGGGTLDVALTEVRANSNGTMNIRYIDGDGAGENHSDSKGNVVGDAGIAFMQDVVVRAMREQGYLAEDEVPNYQDPKFKKTVKEFENKLINQSSKVNQQFLQYGKYDYVSDIMEEDTCWFTELQYGNEEQYLDISYQHIYASYHDVIEGVLKNVIVKFNNVVKTVIRRDPREITALGNDDFKVALVGGFGNFVLVQMQIFQLFNIDPDIPYSGMMTNTDGGTKELAVSKGAALIAARRVDLKIVARFSVGIRAYRRGNEHTDYYAIRFGDCLRNGDPQYCMRGNTRARIANISGREGLLINNTGSDTGGIVMPMKEHMVQKIHKQIAQLENDGGIHFWYIGFSMDDSGILTFHITDANDPSINIPIHLARHLDLFEENLDVTDL